MSTLTLTAAATAAAQYLQVLDSGESLSAQQLTDALAYTNSALDNLSIDQPMVLSVALQTFPFVAAQQAYTIGTGANFNTARPVMIPAAALVLTNGPGSPIQMLSAQQWTAVPDRQANSWQVRFAFYDRGFATGNLYFSPIPLGGSVQLVTFSPLTQFADTTTPITMPGPGYLDLYTFACMFRMASQMAVTVPPAVAEQAQAAFERIRKLNAEILGSLPPEMAMAAAAATK